jgi:hypothetical protein
VKNNRREGETDPGFWAQLGRGIKGGVSEGLAQRAGKQASHEMNNALADTEISQTLKFAKDVKETLGLPQTKVEVPLSQPPRPGDATPSGVKEIAISIPESTTATGGAGTSTGTSGKGKEKVEQ